MLHNKTI